MACAVAVVIPVQVDTEEKVNSSTTQHSQKGVLAGRVVGSSNLGEAEKKCAMVRSKSLPQLTFYQGVDKKGEDGFAPSLYELTSAEIDKLIQLKRCTPSPEPIGQ